MCYNVMSIRKIIIFILAIVCGCGVTIKKTNAKIVRITVKEKKELCFKKSYKLHSKLRIKYLSQKGTKIGAMTIRLTFTVYVCVCVCM